MGFQKLDDKNIINNVQGFLKPKLTKTEHSALQMFSSGIGKDNGSLRGAERCSALDQRLNVSCFIEQIAPQDQVAMQVAGRLLPVKRTVGNCGKVVELDVASDELFVVRMEVGGDNLCTPTCGNQ